ncbi:MAG: tetratricopeptide repeat protein [Chloroflexi bacterium]|nr:MAG: tetratricopeptide repeat protein [Chloroflexota bacterium]
MARLTQRLGFTRYQADEYYKMALDFYRRGRFDDAVDHITYAIEELPRSEYFATRGLIYMEDGLPEKAQPDFEEALRLYPVEMLAHYGLGMLAYRAKKWDEAITHFTQAYHADPQRPETLYYLALAYHRNGNNPVALQLMEVAHGIFENADDRRRIDANKWIRELKKLLDDAPAPQPELPPQQQPLLDE